MPKRQVPRAIDALTGLKAAIGAWGVVDPDRLGDLPEDERQAFLEQAKAKTDAAGAVLDLLIADLGPDYVAAAPDKVGLAQYPGGREYYRYLVKRTTTLDTTPEELRDLGMRLLEENNRKLEVLARELGVPNGRAGLRDQRWNHAVPMSPATCRPCPSGLARTTPAHARPPAWRARGRWCGCTPCRWVKRAPPRR